MKKNKLFLLSLVALAALVNIPAYAQDEDAKTTCERWIGDYHDLHCTYVSGLPADSSKGRYIKHYDSTLDISYTRCVSADTVENDISQNEGEFFIGTQNVQYSICTDANAEHCEPLGMDTFTIARDGENYVGTPTTYSINVSAVKDKYPACNGFGMITKQEVKLPFKTKR